MVEHRMDTGVLQALLADAWEQGHWAATMGDVNNPYWFPDWHQDEAIAATEHILEGDEL